MQDLRKWIENPDHVVESEGFTCEEGVKYLQRTIASSFCDEGKMTAKDAGCRCKSPEDDHCDTNHNVNGERASPGSTNKNIAILLVVSAATTMVAFLE